MRTFGDKEGRGEGMVGKGGLCCLLPLPVPFLNPKPPPPPTPSLSSAPDNVRWPWTPPAINPPTAAIASSSHADVTMAASP